MVRRKKIPLLSACCLILSLDLAHAQTQDFHLGKVTQANGVVTFLEYSPPHKLSEVSTGGLVLGTGSYLTQENANFTAKLFDGTWLRASPRTKFALEFNPDNKSLTLNLLTGSVKVLFAPLLSDKRVTTFLIRSADAVFESSEAKFTVVRNILTSETSLFVEKGVVNARLNGPMEGKDSVVVHAREMTSLKDRTSDFQSPKQMGERQMKFLNSAFYLGGKTDQSF